MIKGDFLENVVNIFDQHEKFEKIDFKIEINQDILRVIYLIDSDYYIVFKDENNFKDKNTHTEYNIQGEVYPNIFLAKETFILTDKNEVYSKIKNWLDIIWKDISLESPLSLLEEEQRYVDRFCEKYDSLEGYFNTNEILEIKKKLGELKLDLITKLGNMVLDTQTKATLTKKLEKVFDTLEETTLYLKKKGWIRSLIGRIISNAHIVNDLQQKAILSKEDTNNKSKYHS